MTNLSQEALEKRRRYFRDRYAKNVEKERARSRVRYQKEKEQVRQRNARRYLEKREQILQYGRSEYQRTKEKVLTRTREWKLKNVYGITPAQYENMLEQQNGKCANEQCQSKGNLVIDHCHISKRTRGLLCRKCNFALGLLGDSVRRIQGLAKYLEITHGS